jgi:hypothetical protein
MCDFIKDRHSMLVSRSFTVSDRLNVNKISAKFCKYLCNRMASNGIVNTRPDKTAVLANTEYFTTVFEAFNQALTPEWIGVLSATDR